METADSHHYSEDLEKQLREEFKKLSEIPLYLSDEIINQVRRIKDLCPAELSEYLEILTQIEEAVFSRSSKKIPEYLQPIMKI